MKDTYNVEIMETAIKLFRDLGTVQEYSRDILAIAYKYSKDAKVVNEDVQRNVQMLIATGGN